MTLFEHVMLQARSGLSEIDRDLDAARTFEVRYGGGPALDRWMRQLETERAQHLMMMDGLAELQRQNYPALLHHVRFTRMAKAVLRSDRASALREVAK